MAVGPVPKHLLRTVFQGQVQIRHPKVLSRIKQHRGLSTQTSPQLLQGLRNPMMHPLTWDRAQKIRQNPTVWGAESQDQFAVGWAVYGDSPRRLEKSSPVPEVLDYWVYGPMVL